MSDITYYCFVAFVWLIGGLSAVGYGWLVSDALKGPASHRPDHPSKWVYPETRHDR